MSAGFDGGQRSGIAKGLAQLAADGGTIPKPIIDAGNDYDRLIAEAAQVPSASTVRTRLASQIVDGDTIKQAEWSELSSLGDREIVHKMAITEALHRYLAIAKEHADAVLVEIRKCWFDPAVEALTKAANATSSGDTSDDLIRRGRVEDGTAIAMASVELKAVLRAHQMRDRLCNLPQKSTLTSWMDPDLPYAPIHYPTQYLDAIRAGNTPWLPDEEQFIEARDQRKLDLQRADNAKPRIPGNRMSLRM